MTSKKYGMWFNSDDRYDNFNFLIKHYQYFGKGVGPSIEEIENIRKRLSALGIPSFE